MKYNHSIKTVMLSLCMFISTSVLAESERFVRFKHKGVTSYGLINEGKIQAITTSPFETYKVTGKIIDVNDVELLVPTQAQKVFAVGMNFASHLASPSDSPPPLFLKLPSSLIVSGKDIQLPKDAKNVHFEGELVLVIGKTLKNANQQQAKAAIFGVTVGNDLTERSWQGRDLQWMRAKASDGFGPVGLVIATGVDFNNVLLTTRLNGKVVQQENTSHMIHKPAKVVSYLSQYFTLLPGDLIFMGTPGRTQALKHNDIVSVTIDGVGKVENIIKAD